MRSPTKSPQVAVIGAGHWGRNLIRDFRDLGALRLVCDSNKAALEAIAGAYPGIKTAADLSEVLADPEIKGVALATPAPSHAKLALMVLEAGLDVFVEKPLALSMDDGLAMVRMAANKGRILMVDHLLNRHPAVERLKAMIQAGELGQVVHVESARRNFGIIRVDENALWSLAPHAIALVLAMVGATPKTVTAVGGGWLTPNVEDAVTAHLAFEGGATGLINVSWLHPVKEQRLCVSGLKAMAVFDDLAPWESKLKIYRQRVDWRGGVPKAERAEGEAVPLIPAQPLKAQCQMFLDAIESGAATPDSDSLEALRVLSVLTGLERSLKEGAPMVAGREGLSDFDAVISSGLEAESLKGFERGEGLGSEAPALISKASEEKAAAGRPPGGYQAHPTAVIDPGVEIGPGTKIWHFSHVMAGSVIGEGVNIGQNVVVGPKAKIGRGSKIQNNVSVYEGVELEEDVFCGPSMVFTNVFNPRAFIKRMDELRRTLVRRGASIGANATIVCGVELGEYCFIGAGAVVASDVKAHALMAGVPARRTGWVCRCGVKLPETLVCPACASSYREAPDGLVEARP